MTEFNEEAKYKIAIQNSVSFYLQKIVRKHNKRIPFNIPLQ